MNQLCRQIWEGVEDPFIQQYGSVLSPFPNTQVLKSPLIILVLSISRPDLSLTTEYGNGDGMSRLWLCYIKLSCMSCPQTFPLAGFNEASGHTVRHGETHVARNWGSPQANSQHCWSPRSYHSQEIEFCQHTMWFWRQIFSSWALRKDHSFSWYLKAKILKQKTQDMPCSSYYFISTSFSTHQ